MDTVNVTIGNDGGKNVTVFVSGILTKDVTLLDLFKFSQLSGTFKGLRFESVTFAIQEKAGFYLWWKGQDSNKSLILPLESRGFFDFEKLGCLPSPTWATGVSLSSFGVDKPKALLLIMDFGKQ